MVAFVSWSGGKDCSLALCSFLKNPSNKILYLVNFVNPKRLSVNLTDDLLSAQSKSLNIPLLRKNIAHNQTYEQCFRNVIYELKKEGVNAGIFGDIYLQSHRDWIERLCNETGIEAVFPLWGMKSRDVVDKFIEEGFRSVIISTKNEEPYKKLIGRELDLSTISELEKISGADVCGEHGEYHSFVFDAPTFSNSIPIVCDCLYEENNFAYTLLKLNISHRLHEK